MKDFLGETAIYDDKSTDSMLSIKDIVILDKHFSLDKVILSSNKERSKNSEFEDKLTLLRLKKRDSYKQSRNKSYISWYCISMVCTRLFRIKYAATFNKSL